MIMHLLSRCLKARQQEGAEGPVLMHLSKSWMVTQGAAAGGPLLLLHVRMHHSTYQKQIWLGFYTWVGPHALSDG